MGMYLKTWPIILPHCHRHSNLPKAGRVYSKPGQSMFSIYRCRMRHCLYPGVTETSIVLKFLVAILPHFTFLALPINYPRMEKASLQENEASTRRRVEAEKWEMPSASWVNRVSICVCFTITSTKTYMNNTGVFKRLLCLGFVFSDNVHLWVHYWNS